MDDDNETTTTPTTTSASSTPSAFGLFAALFALAFILGIAGTIDQLGDLPGDVEALDYVRACADQAPYAIAAAVCWLGASLRNS